MLREETKKIEDLHHTSLETEKVSNYIKDNIKAIKGNLSAIVILGHLKVLNLTMLL